MKHYYNQKECPICNSTNFYCYDVDYNFEGNQDEYWECEDCRLSVFVKVRFHRIVNVDYLPEQESNYEEKY